nr:copia protein [Tanacetum cinerariifolium]
MNTKFAKQSILGKPPTLGETHALSNPVTSSSIPIQQESKIMKNDKTTLRPEGHSLGAIQRISASKSSRSKNKEVEVEEHHRKLLLSMNKKHMSFECNNIKLANQNVYCKVVCAMCKQCLISVNHDVCFLNYVNDMNSRSKQQTANVSIKEKQKQQKPKVKKHKKVGSIERLATPKRSKPRSFLRWSPTRRMFDLKGKIITFSESESPSDCSKGDNAYTSNRMEPTIKRFPNSTFSLAGQLCDSDLEVAFRRKACFFRNLEGVNLLKGDRLTNLYTINLHDMASASPICLMARASSTKSWLWHQRLSHLNFDTINDLAKNDLVSGLPKFKYHKEHLCPSRETKKIMETMNVSFDELSAMAFEQRSLKPRLQSMTSGQIISGLDLTYAPSTITTQQSSKGELDLLFEAMYDDFIGGLPSAAQRTVLAAQAQQDVDELNLQQQHVQQQGNQASLQPKTVAGNVLNAMFDTNTFVNPFATPSTSFIDADHPSHVYKLKKALYGLKQAPRAWYEELSLFLLQNHFFKGTIDLTLFIGHFDNDILVVRVYVDDIIFGSTHPSYTQLFSDLMKSRFEMLMIGEMMFFLGLPVNQSPCGIFINQPNYVLEILKKYEIESCDPVGTPMEIKDKLDLDQNGTPNDATKYRSMIGALMYLTSSRPDIVHSTCLCARYQAKPTEKHLKKVKRIFRYLRGTINIGLWYTKDSGFKLTGFSDANYAGCKDTFKSTSEYVSLSACCAQVLWMRTQLTDYGFHFKKIPIYCDSKSAIAISCNLVQHSRTKHIAVCYHFIKEHVEKGTIELYFVKMDYQLADLFTKALLVDRFNYLVRRLVLWIFMAIFQRPTNCCFLRSYKVVKVRYIHSMIQPEPTEMELVLEKSQQGFSHEVSCTFPTEGMRSIISMVSISLEGFLPSILLLVVIIVAVVIVSVILVVVVIDAIVGVVIVVVNIEICALVYGPLVCEICWWLPPESEVLKQ